MRQAPRTSTLHFTEHGIGIPIVNLHGWPAEHGQMMAMMEPLFAHRPGWRRIYVDLPGMGLSPGPDWLVSHDQMLEAVSDFIDAVAGDDRVVLAGHSYGATLARGLMAREGSRVGALPAVTRGVRSFARGGRTADGVRRIPGVLGRVDRDGTGTCRTILRAQRGSAGQSANAGDARRDWRRP